MVICDMEKCSGCCACYNICSFDAIGMAEDALGRIVHYVDDDKCSDCGLCKKICPANNAPKSNRPVKCYAMYSRSKTDSKSSSGGASALLGRSVTAGNGVVYGVAFDGDMKAVYTSADDNKELDSFRGSKYVYAFPGKIFVHIKSNLEQGKRCFFVGTPCHVAGLKSFLGNKEWPNLYTADLICHGTPPAAYLDQHLKDISVNREIDNVTFRGEHNYFLTLMSNGKIAYKKRWDEDAYFSAFMHEITFRENCYSCDYACGNRMGDITIGDFWELGKDALEGYPGKVSTILVNTEKGNEMVSWMYGEAAIEERPIQEAVVGNLRLCAPSVRPADRSEFSKVYVESGFRAAIEATGIAGKIRIAKIKNLILRFPRYIRRVHKQKGAESYF